MNSENDIMNTEENHMRGILAYFEGLDEPPSDFFKIHGWILYLHLGICVHGFIMNSFLVRFILFYVNLP